MRVTRLLVGLAGSVTAGLIGIGPLVADGTESLGPPQFFGPGFRVKATGLMVGAAGPEDPAVPLSLEVSVPEEAEVTGVLLYVTGFILSPPQTVVIQGIEVRTQLIGGPAPELAAIVHTTFRADITALGLVRPGDNSLTIDAVRPGGLAQSVAVVVAFDEPDKEVVFHFRDGQDLAMDQHTGPFADTVPETFRVRPSLVAREATVDLELEVLFPGALDLEVLTGPDPGGNLAVQLAVEGGRGGHEQRHVQLPIIIPAGARFVTVHLTPARFPQVASHAAAIKLLTAALFEPQLRPAGCPPDFWKEPAAWPATGISPEAIVGGAFPAAEAFPGLADVTLIEALDFRGGPDLEGAARLLLREAVTARLNIFHPDIDAVLTDSELSEAVRHGLESRDRVRMLQLAGALAEEQASECGL